MNLKFPLYLAPDLNWFKSIESAQTIEISNRFKFNQQSEYNRIVFAGPHGKQQFSIPLVAESKKGDFSEVLISYQENWHNQLINALRTAYGKSPFYEFYDYKLEPIIRSKEPFLAKFNLKIMEFLLEAFKLNVSIRLVEGEPDMISRTAEMSYYQVFSGLNGFIPNLSALDFLFNAGWDMYGDELDYKQITK